MIKRPWKYTLIVFCLAALLVAAMAGPASSALASNWTLRQLPPASVERTKEGTSYSWSSLNGVSCPSPSLCVAVGGLNTVAFSTAPTGGAAKWHVVRPTYDEPNQACLERGESIEFCSSPRGSLGSVSCPSESLCVAVGYEGSVYVSTDPTGGAASWSVRDVNEGGRGATHLISVSCPSPALCVAVSGGSNNSNGGRVLTSTNPASGDWQAIQLSSSLDLRGVSCGSTSLCVAVAREGRIFVSTDPTGGASAWREVGSPGGPGDLEGVNCFSSLLCAAGNAVGNILTSTEPAGAAAGWGEANAGRSVQITAVSCPAANRCLAVDNNGDVLASTNPTAGAASWHSENLVPFRPTAEQTGLPPQNALFGAGCASTSLSVLVGSQSRIFTSSDPFSVPADPPHRRHRALLRPHTILMFAEHFWETMRSPHHLRARFHFYSPTGNRGFECKRDRHRYHRCRSPIRYRVGYGRHVLRARAIGPTGLRGPAASKHFEVLRPHERGRLETHPHFVCPHGAICVGGG